MTRNSKRKAWAKIALDLPIPPQIQSELATWRAETFEALRKQNNPPIPGACAVDVRTCVGDHDPLHIASEVTRLLREAEIVAGANVVSVEAGMDRLVAPGWVHVTAWRTTPPAARIRAEIRQRHGERQAMMFQALRTLRFPGSATA